MGSADGGSSQSTGAMELIYFFSFAEETAPEVKETCPRSQEQRVADVLIVNIYWFLLMSNIG